jgi:hypothetical protein
MWRNTQLAELDKNILMLNFRLPCNYSAFVRLAATLVWWISEFRNVERLPTLVGDPSWPGTTINNYVVEITYCSEMDLFNGSRWCFP